MQKTKIPTRILIKKLISYAKPNLRTTPAAVALLLEKIERIDKLLSGMEDKKPSEYLDISKAAEYLNLAKATVYSKVCRREIPAYKNGSRLYFKRDELEKWMTKIPILTNTEIAAQADLYIQKRAVRRRF